MKREFRTSVGRQVGSCPATVIPFLARGSELRLEMPLRMCRGKASSNAGKARRPARISVMFRCLRGKGPVSSNFMRAPIFPGSRGFSFIFHISPMEIPVTRNDGGMSWSLSCLTLIHTFHGRPFLYLESMEVVCVLFLLVFCLSSQPR